MSNEQTSQARAAGHAAYQAGRALGSNPHEPSSALAMHWRDGWEDAMQKDVRRRASRRPW